MRVADADGMAMLFRDMRKLFQLFTDIDGVVALVVQEDIAFPSDCPFPTNVFHGGKGKPVHSGPAVNAKADQDFKYIVQIQGSKALDPVVHTDP